ncbi:MAG TPA: MOSC domain-containing protein, partial [Ktedonobacteraceae bacterium]
AGIALQEARMEERGLQYDRRFMIVDESGTFITQRKYPRMALIATGIEGDELHLNAPGMLPLSVPLQPRNGVHVLVRVWSSLCMDGTRISDPTLFCASC